MFPSPRAYREGNVRIMTPTSNDFIQSIVTLVGMLGNKLQPRQTRSNETRTLPGGGGILEILLQRLIEFFTEYTEQISTLDLIHLSTYLANLVRDTHKRDYRAHWYAKFPHIPSFSRIFLHISHIFQFKFKFKYIPAYPSVFPTYSSSKKEKKKKKVIPFQVYRPL